MQADSQNVPWTVDRQGANHTVFRLGATMIPVPRHTEIDNRLAEAIFKQSEPELGERWWK